MNWKRVTIQINNIWWDIFREANITTKENDFFYSLSDILKNKHDYENKLHSIN